MKFLVMPGDGIGPEIVPVAVAALEALDRKLGLGISLEEVPIGFASLETAGNTFPDEALARARDRRDVLAALQGRCYAGWLCPVGDPAWAARARRSAAQVYAIDI